MAFSPDRATLAAGGSSILLWDLDDGDESSPPSRIIETNGREASDLVCSPNGIFLAAVVDCATSKIWRASDGSLERGVGGRHSASVSFYSPNGKLVAIGGNHCTDVELWTI